MFACPSPLLDLQGIAAPATRMARNLSAMPGVLHDLQLSCCWVTALVKIWPGSILAASGGAGLAAADTLLLCAKYLDLVSRMHRINLVLTQHQQQQQQQQDQQQLLLQLPAVDITAAVLHTASLLLADLPGLMQQSPSLPAAVARLLANREALQQIACVVTALFGSQLQLHMLQQLDLQSPHSSSCSSSGSGCSSSGSGCSSSGCSSSGSGCSSSGSCHPAAEMAEGVLLCRVQQFLQSPQQHLQPSISTPVVQSWLQHFKASWGEMLPPHLLQHVAAAIAALPGASAAPQQHPSTGGQVVQAYQLLLPEHCLDPTGPPCFAAEAPAGSSSSFAAPCINVQACVKAVFAAAAVLGPDSTPEHICKLLSHSPGMQRVPLLLLASAVAVPCTMSVAALPLATRMAGTARQLLSAIWCGGTDEEPCTVCAELLTPLAWHTVGLASLHMQQVAAHAVEVINQRTSCSTSSTSSSSVAGPATGEAAAEAEAAARASALPTLVPAGFGLQGTSCSLL